jgi:hypothetical protein
MSPEPHPMSIDIRTSQGEGTKRFGQISYLTLKRGFRALLTNKEKLLAATMNKDIT